MDIIDFVEELRRLKFEVKIINQVLSEIDHRAMEPPLTIGSRVKVNWVTGDVTLGRIVGIRNSDGAFYVHRDGYAGVIGLGINKPEILGHTLENLSIGPYGKLDQMLWSNQKRIEELNKSIREIVRSDSTQLDQLI